MPSSNRRVDRNCAERLFGESPTTTYETSVRGTAVVPNNIQKKGLYVRA
jgi:hypothetical protein